MTVRIPLTPKLLAALCVIASTGGGCSDTSSSTDLAATPTVEQVMVTVNPILVNCTGECVDPLADPLSSFELTFGWHPQMNQCGFDPNTETRIGDCPVTAQGDAQKCATDGLNKGTCVDALTNKPPIVKHAAAYGIEMRVVVGELLDGKTLEAFACACQSPTDPDLHPLIDSDPSYCEGATAWTSNPHDCSSCGGGEVVKGKCIDLDGNGLPDKTGLLPDLATIKCPADGSLVNYSVGSEEGYFYPSGNQLRSSQIGLMGLGPAVVFQPLKVLPTGTDCFLTISDKIKTKQGESLQVDDPINGNVIQFQTDTLGFDTSTSTFKPKNKTTGVPVGTPGLVIVFNSSLAAATVNPTNFIVTDPSGTAVPGTSVSVKGRVVTIKLPTTGLAATTKYTVTVKQGVTDTYGKGLGADLSYFFTTK